MIRARHEANYPRLTAAEVTTARRVQRQLERQSAELAAQVAVANMARWRAQGLELLDVANLDAIERAAALLQEAVARELRRRRGAP